MVVDRRRDVKRSFEGDAPKIDHCGQAAPELNAVMPPAFPAERIPRAKALALACAALAGCAAPSGNQRPASGPNLPWDWTGIIGTGQSLSVGARAGQVVSTVQPYNNLKLSTDHLPWPVDPDDPGIALEPLVEPVGRLAPSYPSSWPENIDGETPHAAMGNEITALVRAGLGRDFISVHSAVGEDGQGMVFLKKGAVEHGLNGRSYEAAMIVTKAVTRLARAAGKTYGVGGIIVTHGESDAGNPDYEAELHRLWQDYNADLAAITGQSQRVQMIVSQQNSCSDRSPSALAQWKIGVDYPDDVVCSGPKYQYPYFNDGVHLTAAGYRMLGEKYAEVYFQRVILGKPWEPLQPVAVGRSGAVITVRFHVPAPPLAWETAFSPCHPSVAEWARGRGFEVTRADGTRVGIASVEISGDSVIIACSADPGPGCRLGYAMIGEPAKMAAPYGGTFRWGMLRDSDTFRGAATGTLQPNYCVAFELEIPAD
jgi:lysophospholipase L1-like esterase